ncbi:MAG TPA: hypothetical protein VM658_14605 [bacterium]|nr:hypothetical protein [bacterium]
MALNLGKEGTITLRVGDNAVRVEYRRPDPHELIETLVKKMPRGDEAEDAMRILHANLELGLACITGVGDGDLTIDGAPLVTMPESAGFHGDWKQAIADLCPLILIALGQYLSATPAFMEETALKKSSGMPG